MHEDELEAGGVVQDGERVGEVLFGFFRRVVKQGVGKHRVAAQALRGYVGVVTSAIERGANGVRLEHVLGSAQEEMLIGG